MLQVRGVQRQARKGPAIVRSSLVQAVGVSNENRFFV